MILIPPKFLGVAAWLAILLHPLHAVEKTVAATRIAQDARSLELPVSGLGVIHCRWAATIENAGSIRRLESDGASQTFKPSVQGTMADGMTVTISSPETKAELLFRIRLEGGIAVCASAGVRNTGRESFKLIDTSPLQASIRIENPADWLLTGLHPQTPVLAPLPGIGGEIHIHEHGTFYQPDGTGFVFGPVGEPVSYADFSWQLAEPGVFGMNAVTPMDGVRVDPGETRWGQEVALVVEKPQAALAHWAASVARSHGARTGKGALAGWNNWNYLAQKDISRELDDVTKVVRDSGGRLRPSIIQMDYNVSDADLKKALEST